MHNAHTQRKAFACKQATREVHKPITQIHGFLQNKQNSKIMQTRKARRIKNNTTFSKK